MSTESERTRAAFADLGFGRSGDVSTSKGRVPKGVFKEALELVESSGVIDMLAGWRDEDDPDRVTRGGRPSIIGDRAVLVGLLVLGLMDDAPSVKELHALLRCRMSDEMRREAGVPSEYERNGRFSYDAVREAMARLAQVIDPFVVRAHERLPFDEVQSARKALEPQVAARKQGRTNAVGQALVDASIRMARPWLRGTVSVTLDGTVIPLWGQDGHRAWEKGEPSRTCSPEVNGGLHAKDDSKRASVNSTRSRRGEYVFGYEAHIAMTANPRSALTQPRMILGFRLDTPGMDPATNAVEIAHAISRQGHAALGDFVTDRGYSKSPAPRFARPLIGLGFRPVFDYKKTDKLPTGGPGGSLIVAGGLYSPGTPQALLMCHADFDAGLIDETVYRQRVRQLAAYRMVPKQAIGPDTHSIVFRCPAAGPSPTAVCANKPNPAAVTRGKRTALTIIHTPPADTPLVCSNKESFSVPLAQLPTGWQELQYGSDEWRDAYRPARSQMEGHNGFLKTTGLRLADAAQRRFRGYGKHVVAIALKFVVANLRALADFLARTDSTDGPNPVPTKRRTGRPPKESFADYAPTEDTPPKIVATPARKVA